MSVLERTTDFLVIGSGGGGLLASIAARRAGADVLVLEKQETVGGNTGLSGGTMWIPDNPLMRAEGIADSAEEAIAYLDAAVGEPTVASSAARKAVYVAELQRMFSFLVALGFPLVRVRGYPDYYDTLPGGNAQGRVVQCDFFDLRQLGPHQERVVNPPVPLIASVREAPEICMALRSSHAALTLGRVVARTAAARLQHRPLVANGAALVGRLLQAAFRTGVDIWTECPVEELLIDKDVVSGVRARRRGVDLTVRARHGVLIACGGYARNEELRRRFGRQPSSQEWTMANLGETGEVIEQAIAIGAATALMDEGIWMPMSLSPSGPLYNVYERAQPHAIIVNGDGRRYVDEAATYMAVGQAMYDEQQRTGRGIPSWIVIDSRHRRHYPWGLQPPGLTPKSWFSSGYMKRAGSIAELAGQCQIEPANLEQTVASFNRFAAAGVDEDFHRAESAYGRFFGDPRNRPNPGLGTIERPPFYAVALYPGDLGTFGGILTDEHARVLRQDGSTIDGLYATGTATAPVTGRTYPATGSSIGGTMVWGFAAAQHALGRLGGLEREPVAAEH